MKKYLCLALLAFFGAAILSPVMAPPPADGDKANAPKDDGGPKKGKKKHKHR